MWSAFQLSILEKVEKGNRFTISIHSKTYLLTYQQFLIESEVLQGKLKVLNVF